MKSLILVCFALASTERYSDAFDLDAERHVAQSMVAELYAQPDAVLSELELAHLYSPTNIWLTKHLVQRLVEQEANITRAREIIETALLYEPESPGLNRVYALFELSHGSIRPQVVSSIWRLIEHPSTRSLGYTLLESTKGALRTARFKALPSTASEGPKASCSQLAAMVLRSDELRVPELLEKLHQPQRGCWK